MMLMKSKVDVKDGVALDKQTNLTVLQFVVHAFYRMPIPVQALMMFLIASLISVFGVHWLLCIPIAVILMFGIGLWEKKASEHLP